MTALLALGAPYGAQEAADGSEAGSDAPPKGSGSQTYIRAGKGHSVAADRPAPWSAAFLESYLFHRDFDEPAWRAVRLADNEGVLLRLIAAGVARVTWTAVPMSSLDQHESEPRLTMVKKALAAGEVRVERGVLEERVMEGWKVRGTIEPVYLPIGGDWSAIRRAFAARADPYVLLEQKKFINFFGVKTPCE